MSDDLIGRADTLMRRSRTFVAGHPTSVPADDGIPLLTEEVDFEALNTPPEPEDRTEEITAAVTAEITERVTSEVTERVTAEVTDRVTGEVTERVTGEVAGRVTLEVAERVRGEVRASLQHATSAALAQHFADLPDLIQSLIDDWSSSTLPVLVGLELQAALEAALGEAVQNAAARIREQAVLDLRDSLAAEVEARSLAALGAALAADQGLCPPEGTEQPL